jgi:hypothetical protein
MTMRFWPSLCPGDAQQLSSRPGVACAVPGLLSRAECSLRGDNIDDRTLVVEDQNQDPRVPTIVACLSPTEKITLREMVNDWLSAGREECSVETVIAYLSELRRRATE